MARKRVELTLDNSSLSFSELFQSKLSKLCTFNNPDPILCSTGSSLLDTIIGGGLLTGRYHVFAAPAHSGKSTTCIKTIANFLNSTGEDSAALWIDGEQATPPNRLIQLGIPYQHDKDIEGKDIIDQYTGLPKPLFTEDGKDVIWDNRFFRVPVNIPLEKAFELIDACIQVKIERHKEANPLLVVFDSLDSLPTLKEIETDDVDKAIGQRAKVLGYYMKRYLYKLTQYNICVIFITHIGKKLSMQGPYEAYDGKMSSLKDFTVAGGKPIQFYPYNMIFFRSRIGKTVDDMLQDMGVPAGFIVEATTLKAKSFSSNLVVPLVFNSLKGFDEYPTRFYNMAKNKWFNGTVSKTMPEFPDDKFNTKTFFSKIEEDPEFKKKVDISWQNYLDEHYKKYHSIMNSMNEINQNVDYDSFDETETQQMMQDFISYGDVGETTSQTPNTATFDEKELSDLDMEI